MLISAFLIFLVYSTLSNSIIIINRLGLLTISYIFYLLLNSINIVSLSPGITLYNNWFNFNSYNLPIMFIILIFIISLLIYNTSNNRYDLKSPFYIILILSNIIGLLLFPLVNDLVALYIIIELQSYSLYLLTGLHNRSYNATRSSLLYFLMGGIASTIILLSSYYIYNLTGSTNISDIIIFNLYNNDNYIYFDILLIALLFKMGMAPLHRWSISVYNYAPTYITAYISIVAKLSIISWIFTNANLFNNYILIIFFYISLCIGSYKPLYQINIKTILAYSGILNFGYILLSIINYDISFYIYIIQYVLTHLILFTSLLIMNQYIDKPITKWSPLLYIHQLKIPNNILILSLILALFSLIGIPPLPGFYAKLSIISTSINDNYILEVISIVTFSVIATYYYANIIKILISNILNNNNNNNNPNTSNIVGGAGAHNIINPSIAYVLSVSIIILISFFIYLPYISEGLYLIIV